VRGYLWVRAIVGDPVSRPAVCVGCGVSGVVGRDDLFHLLCYSVGVFRCLSMRDVQWNPLHPHHTITVNSECVLPWLVWGMGCRHVTVPWLQHHIGMMCCHMKPLWGEGGGTTPDMTHSRRTSIYCARTSVYQYGGLVVSLSRLPGTTLRGLCVTVCSLLDG